MNLADSFVLLPGTLNLILVITTISLVIYYVIFTAIWILINGTR